MSIERTPQEWVESRGDWLMDVTVVENGFGTFDVAIRVDGSYADRKSAEHFAERHREEIHGMVRRLHRERGWRPPSPIDPPWPFGGELSAVVPEPEILEVHVGDHVDAANLLHACRHQLPNDVLRSLQSIWFCASAARFGQPYEPFWEDQDAAAYAEHNTAECEAGNAADGEPDAA